MKAKNKLLTLLILPALPLLLQQLTKQFRFLPFLKIFWLNQNHFVSNGVLAMFTIQKKELENRFY